MKKLLIILLMLILVTGCKEREIKELSSEVIIRYVTQSNYGTETDPYYEIKVYADKHIIFGYSHLDGFKQRELTDIEYQEIVDYIQSDKFLKLDKDLTNSSILDGSVSHITVYYADGTSFKVGGTNVTNKTYIKLVEMLEEYEN